MSKRTSGIFIINDSLGDMEFQKSDHTRLNQKIEPNLA